LEIVVEVKILLKETYSVDEIFKRTEGGKEVEIHFCVLFSRTANLETCPSTRLMRSSKDLTVLLIVWWVLVALFGIFELAVTR